MQITFPFPSFPYMGICMFPGSLLDKYVTLTCVVLLACCGCHNKVQQTGWLKQQEFILLRVLETGNPKSRCCSLDWVGLGWSLPQTVRCVSLACKWPSSLCVFLYHLPSLHICLCIQISPFYRGTGHFGLEPILMVPSFNLITSVKTLSPNKVPLWETGV